MDQSLNYLFKYLEKENISYDKEELIFQISSNPNFPSILAVIDTLDFFNIENGVLNIDFSEIELLPNRFVALLNNDLGQEEFFFIEKKSSDFIIYRNNKTSVIKRDILENKWKNITLLLEQNNDLDITKKENNYFKIFSWFILFSFIAIITIEVEFKSSILFIIITLGILFSVSTLKDVFNLKSEILSKICTLGESSNCESVSKSRKWKFFNFVNLSDVSIVFFSFQFLLLSYSIITKNVIYFSILLFIILTLSIPLFIISLYFQKFVEKKWCPLCLLIMLTSIIELIYLYYLIDFKKFINLNYLFTAVYLALLCSLSWVNLKKSLLNLNGLKESKKKSLKFERNIFVFKNSLLAHDKTILPDTPIILGNKSSENYITLITNPFCGHCKDAHDTINKILISESNNLQINILFKVNLEIESEKNKKLFYSLHNIYFQYGEKAFKNAIDNWFENKDIDKWLQEFDLSNINIMKINELLENNSKWCIENNFNYTPAVFINGFSFPEQFERENLFFYAKEISFLK